MEQEPIYLPLSQLSNPSCSFKNCEFPSVHILFLAPSRCIEDESVSLLETRFLIIINVCIGYYGQGVNCVLVLKSVYPD